MSPRQVFVWVTVGALACIAGSSLFWLPALWALLPVLPIAAVGVADMLQTRQSIRRNFPIIGNLRYLFEKIRPELQQYFVESNTSGRPFSRELRSVVYQRAKNAIDTKPFGTELDVYATGYEWLNHSLIAKHPPETQHRVVVGGKDCKLPYRASLLNISAMSYGALSKNAIMALNRGAMFGGFAHNTGEGGLSPYHLQGGDLIWQVGTGYFGCRDRAGNFAPQAFAEKAARDEIKMIELKLSQGAKPGHGGILPAGKVTAEIATIRDVSIGEDVLSPPSHSTFSTPIELCEFIGKLRELSGGKPIGFKLCVGKQREFFAICKAMLATGIAPDFITVDGSEGGTGAAPIEFSNRLGLPLDEGLVFVHNALTGIGLRHEVRIIASGRVVTGFGIAQKLAMGADLCNSARAMMFALGCIQALQCNTNKCPTGVATQDPQLVLGLDVPDKSLRVFNFHRNTVKAFNELLAAAGLSRPEQLRPWHVHRRVSATQVLHYGEIFHYLRPYALLEPTVPSAYARDWNSADPASFDPAIRDGLSAPPAARGLRADDRISGLKSQAASVETP